MESATLPKPDSDVVLSDSSSEEADAEEVDKSVGGLLYQQVRRGHYSLDVEVVVGGDGDAGKLSMKLHKCVMATASPVFETMFSGSFSESTSNVVPITDVRPEVFEKFVQFIYTQKANLTTWDQLLQGYYLATKYLVEDFKTFCEKGLREAASKPICNKANFDFVVNCFEEADHLGTEGEAFIQELTRKALLGCDLKRLFEDEAHFGGLSRKFMEFFLDLEGFEKVNEFVFFKAAHRWAMAEARRENIDGEDPKNLRSILGDLLYKIRFPLISNKLLATEVAESGLMDKNDLYEILLSKNGGNCLKFSRKRRFHEECGPGKKVVIRPRITASGWLDMRYIQSNGESENEISFQQFSDYHSQFHLKFAKDVEILEIEFNGVDKMWKNNEYYDFYVKLSGHYGAYVDQRRRKIVGDRVKFTKPLKLLAGSKMEVSMQKIKKQTRSSEDDDEDDYESSQAKRRREKAIAPKIPSFDGTLVKLTVRGAQDPGLWSKIKTTLASLPISSITVREAQKKETGAESRKSSLMSVDDGLARLVEQQRLAGMLLDDSYHDVYDDSCDDYDDYDGYNSDD